MPKLGIYIQLLLGLLNLIKIRINSFSLENNVYNSEFNTNIDYDFTHFCLNLFYDLGVRTIFSVPGAHIEYFILEVAKDNRFNLVISAHEEGAGFMADDYFRKSKQTSVVATIKTWRNQSYICSIYGKNG